MPRLTALPPASPSGATETGVLLLPRQPKPAQRFDLFTAPSAIDGMGVFTREAIPARRKLGELRGESISVKEARRRAKRLRRIHIVEVSATRAVDASGSTDVLRNINHSCAPNTQMLVQQGRVEFYSRRDIAPGEELSCDYGLSHHAGRLVCRCGAPNCSGAL